MGKGIKILIVFIVLIGLYVLEKEFVNFDNFFGDTEIFNDEGHFTTEYLNELDIIIERSKEFTRFISYMAIVLLITLIVQINLVKKINTETKKTSDKSKRFEINRIYHGKINIVSNTIGTLLLLSYIWFQFFHLSISIIDIENIIIITISIGLVFLAPRLIRIYVANSQIQREGDLKL